MEAVRSVGYMKKSLAHGDGGTDDSVASTVIDVVVTHFEGSWANLVLAGVGREAAAAGLDLVLTLAQPGSDWASRVLRRRSLGIVGVLLDPSEPQFNVLSAAGSQLVLIEPMRPAPASVAGVGVANWDAGRMAAEHLLSLGHRRMGVIAGLSRHIYSRARVDGFRSAVDAATQGRARVAVAPGQWDEERAAADTHKLLDADPGITAIFACSDPMALGVYTALAARGLRIPDDVSVIGFDDLPEAHWISPALTTIRQPSTRIGETAVKLLLDQRRNPADPRPRSRLEMAAELVVRASTGPVRAGGALG